VPTRDGILPETDCRGKTDLVIRLAQLPTLLGVHAVTEVGLVVPVKIAEFIISFKTETGEGGYRIVAPGVPVHKGDLVDRQAELIDLVPKGGGLEALVYFFDRLDPVEHRSGVGET